MKVLVRQKVLVEALNKGSVAAISDAARSDTTTLSLLHKSIKITADKHLIVESTSNLLASKFGVLVSEENGVSVKESGTIVVSAKEFIDWVKLQNDDSTIGISLQKLQTPEAVNPSADSDDSKFSIKKIGVVKLISKTGNKTTTKWETDCFDPEDKPSVNFGEKADKSFEMQGQSFLDAIEGVRFAAKDTDSEHILDSISIQVCEKALYFVATDELHLALYKTPDTVDIQSNNALLISASLLDIVSKIISKDEKIVVSHSLEKEKVYVSQTNLRIRMVNTEKQSAKKFPEIESLLKKTYKPLTECSKDSMLKLLANASFANSSAALFVFVKDNGTLTVTAISEDSKVKPNIRQCEIGTVSKDVKAVWGVTHLAKGLRAMKTEDVQLLLPENMRSLKIMPKNNSNLVYFTMVIDNPTYRALVSA